jgi:restriction system protein
MRVLQYVLVAVVVAVMTAKATQARADQAAQAYWVCDEGGRRTAQDHPCDAAHPQKDRRVVHPGPSSLLPSPASAVSGASDLLPVDGSIDHFAPAIKWVAAGLGLLALLRLLALALRRPGSSQDSLGSDERSTSTSRWAPRFSARRPRTWSLELIRLLEWKRFQALCAAVWSAEGYRAVETGDGSDDGVDVRLYAAGDADKPALIIQCKPQCSRPVSVSSVRELFTHIHQVGAREGILVASAGFAADTMIYSGGKPITLVDGEMLFKKLQLLAPQEQAKLLKEIARGDYWTPSCPQCGLRMVKRRSSDGAFWVCRKHPDCQRRFAFEP